MQVLPCRYCQRSSRCCQDVQTSHIHGKRSPLDNEYTELKALQIIGGLHLGGPELAYRIEPTVDFFANKLRPSPTYVLPMHCSGFPAKVALERALGDACIAAGTGMKVEVVGDQEAESLIFPPVVS